MKGGTNDFARSGRYRREPHPPFTLQNGELTVPPCLFPIAHCLLPRRRYRDRVTPPRRQGVSAKRQKYYGGSAAQSTLFPALDAALEVSHSAHSSNAFLLEMRNYMPPGLRARVVVVWSVDARGCRPPSTPIILFCRLPFVCLPREVWATRCRVWPPLQRHLLNDFHQPCNVACVPKNDRSPAIAGASL